MHKRLHDHIGNASITMLADLQGLCNYYSTHLPLGRFYQDGMNLRLSTESPALPRIKRMADSRQKEEILLGL